MKVETGRRFLTRLGVGRRGVPSCDGFRDTFFVGGNDKGHLGDREKEPDCFERLNDGVREAPVQIVNKDDDVLDALHSFGGEQTLELSSELNHVCDRYRFVVVAIVLRLHELQHAIDRGERNGDR